MDKRYKPLAPQDQVRLRRQLYEEIALHPEWSAPEVVRHLRTELRLTLPEMARLCGVSAQTLQNVELGKASPTLATLDKLLAPFGLRLSVWVRPDLRTALPGDTDG